MVEAIVSGVISLVIFAVGYGALKEKISSLEASRKEHNDKIDKINEINVTLAVMKNDIHSIKTTIENRSHE
jgi:dipeptide/tripeptide permease